MKMVHVTINSKKFDESIKFYQDVVGLNIAGDLRGKGPKNIVFLSNGEGETSIEIIESEDAPYEGGGISIGFKADDVEAKREELAAAGYEVSPMIAPNPHVKFFFVKDPNGVSIQFI